MELSNVQIGMFSSVVTELLKFFPLLNVNELTRALTTIVVVFLGTITFSNLSLEGMLSSLLVALVSYKMVIQPVAKVSGLATQK